MYFHDDPNDNAHRTAMRLQTRELTDEQLNKFEGYASEIFSAFGLDLNTPATAELISVTLHTKTLLAFRN